jgi:hypothetical protein
MMDWRDYLMDVWNGDDEEEEDLQYEDWKTAFFSQECS